MLLARIGQWARRDGGAPGAGEEGGPLSADPDRRTVDGAVQYVCPSCHLHLLSWIQHMDAVDMFHKVALWSDFWTGDIRLICQYCLGATEVLPGRLVDLLKRRYGFYVPSPTLPGTTRGP